MQEASALPPPPSVVEHRDLLDPITHELMADPVLCEDGHTYERSVIERCFQERVKAEQERQEELARVARGEDVPTDDTRCSSRPPIELVSPLTGARISPNLIPNRLIEIQIVRLVEANDHELSKDDFDEWKSRRVEKKQREQQANEDKRKSELEREARSIPNGVIQNESVPSTQPTAEPSEQPPQSPHPPGLACGNSQPNLECVLVTPNGVLVNNDLELAEAEVERRRVREEVRRSEEQALEKKENQHVRRADKAAVGEPAPTAEEPKLVSQIEQDEACALQVRREQEEDATRSVYATAKEEGNARHLGGRGELRMCGKCKCGPIMNHACDDLDAHNNNATTYAEFKTVMAKEKPNHCPSCGWFNPDFSKWPIWDGIEGPHE